jgi:ribosomal-protein-alanine N-acetyltransferase
MRGWLAGDYEAALFEHAGEALAYALWCPEPGGVYLRQFFVAREWRRRGVGRQAFALLRREILPPGARLSLEVLPGNQRALRFWEALGFRTGAPPAGRMGRLETERLLIRGWREEEWLALRPVASDPEVMRFIAHGRPWSDDEIRRLVARQIEHERRLGFCLGALLEKPGERLIGLCGIGPLGKSDEIEIGWWLARERWGRGLASEAARRMLRFGFESAGLRRIIAVARPQNAASRAVMERIGMRFEREARAGDFGLAAPDAEIVVYAAEAPGAGAPATRWA